MSISCFISVKDVVYYLVDDPILYGRGMRYSPALMVLLIVLFLFSSCGDTGFLLDDAGENDFIIESIEEGAVLKSDDEITVTLVYDEGVYTPDSLEIVLVDGEENVIGSTILTGADLVDPLPPVSLPQLEPGYYVIRYTVRSGDEVISEAEFPFFYTEEDFLVQGISIYPPVILPNGSGLLQAELLIPETADPFLRWSTDDTLIFEGFLSEGADRIEWQVPDSAGVYVISFELFPYGNGVSDFYSFHSSVFHEARIYVGDKQGVAKGDLVPEESYFSLYHLKGALLDTGAEGNEQELRETGQPALDIREGVFGYFFDGVSGLVADRSLIPFSDDSAVPFSVIFKFLLEEEQVERDFFRLLRSSNETVFGMYTNTMGELLLVLNSEAGSALVSSGIFNDELEFAKELTVNIVPGDEETVITWFIDGLYSGSTAVPFVFAVQESEDYTSVIGGNRGFIGLLDEFGVYYRAESGGLSEDRNVFRRSMEEKYGKALLIADGLDGTVNTEAVTIEGAFDFMDGAVLLEEESSFLIADPGLLDGETIFALDIEVPEDAVPLLYRHPEKENTIVFGFGPATIDALPFPVGEAGIECSISFEDEVLLLHFEGIEEPFRFEGDFESLDIMVDNPAGAATVMIHSILMYKTSTQIADNDNTETAIAQL